MEDMHIHRLHWQAFCGHSFLSACLRQYMRRVYRHLSRGRCDHKYICQLCEVLIFLIPCFFFFPQGKFPGKGGMVAPGMTCQYTVQFIPESLGDYEDCILVETQVSEPLLIPILAKRPPPVLTRQ